MQSLDHTGRFRPIPQGRADSVGESTGSPLRVLVVDDNIDSAHTMALYLSLYGHEVQEAHDGLEALSVLHQFEPDVAILDIGMPRMDGLALAAHIREHANRGEPLLIAATGWGFDSDIRKSKAAGFDHHLVKPVDPAQLLKLLAARGRR